MKSRISCFAAIFLGLVFSMPALSDVDYVVKPGDSMFRVGKKLGVPGHQVVRANPNFKNPNLVHPGDKIVIPGVVEMEPVEEPKGSPSAPVLSSNTREAEGAISELRARILAVDQANAASNERLERLQAGQGELSGRLVNLGRENQLQREEINRLVAEKEVLEKRLAEAQTRPDVSPKTATAPIAQIYHLPMWTRTALAVLVISILLNIIVLVVWRREKRRVNGRMERMRLRLAEAENYDPTGGIKTLLANEPIEEILADREKLREEKGLPKEKRGEVLHAVLKHFFGDLAENRKPALRAVLRFFFPRGFGLHRQNGAEVMIPCSGGKFTFGQDGSVNVSFYALLGSPGQPEVNFDSLKRLIEETPAVGERLGIPAVPQVPDMGSVSSSTASVVEISQADKEAAYREMIARGRDEIKEMRERASGVPEFRSRVGTTT